MRYMEVTVRTPVPAGATDEELARVKEIMERGPAGVTNDEDGDLIEKVLDSAAVDETNTKIFVKVVEEDVEVSGSDGADSNS